MINKRGLSLIVTTLLIVVLVLVSIGIVWVVVRNIIEGGTEQIDYNTKCLEINIRATAVVNAGDTDYNITIMRTAGGDEVAGVKLVFFNNDNEASDVIDINENIAPLATITRNIDGEIENANKVEVTPYFEDSSGNEKFCSTIPYNF